ncbi:MAG: hypothetical protein JW888_00360 [Pirellulales bacterium]|nr:hypothetical protein [Pirellulales bacterium]
MQFAKFLWPLPWTLLGLVAGLAGLLTGGRARRRGPVIEFYGGAVARLLARIPNRPMAMTLGHVIVGTSAAALDTVRRHELVHVRQYERWGPAFVPVYLFYSVRLWLAGKNAYRDNPFEIEAYRES